MLKMVEAFTRDENGEDLIEYGLLSSFVAAVALAAVVSDPLGIRPSLVAAYQRAADALVLITQGDVAPL